MSETTLETEETGSATELYEADFYAWTQEQAALLRQQHWSQLDLPNLIEEIESLGKQQRRELRNRLRILVGHLLKWEYQSEARHRGWLATLRVQRRDLLRLLNDNPSLKPYLEQALEEAYTDAKDLAIGETNLPVQTFPPQCPYGFSDILDDRFYPGKPSDLIKDFD